MNCVKSHQQVDAPGHDEEGHEKVGDGERHDEEVGRRLQRLLLQGQGCQLEDDRPLKIGQKSEIVVNRNKLQFGFSFGILDFSSFSVLAETHFSAKIERLAKRDCFGR